ncbi:hypothetical protein QVD17_16022 [Tagetes erecta]|uniref:Jacalin-type lectin domain-containing protein n=1 Tax=Tagetes erecta TaxID=13708 RepID=A0AAD8P066_TARER|nr:hypothetical protein QVD17_16022 [Tagetes erecta]
MEAETRFEGCITHGPWGSFNEGRVWVYRPKGFIRKIIVHYGDNVDMIEFQTYSSKGEVKSKSFGAHGHKWIHTICIDQPDEYLVSISGTYGIIEDGDEVVRSICFKTNQKLYGPYGTNTGTVFSHDVKGEVIIGFHGRARSYINAIGVYVMPNPTNKGKIMNESSSSKCLMAMPREAGPWGADGAKPWDDGVFSTVKQVRVHVGELNVIYALQFEYLKKDGKSVLSPIHGGTDGSKIEMVNLDGEEEFLTYISGFVGPVEGYNGLKAIVSISFHTNKQIHGPYGEETGAGYVYFSSAASIGEVVGFHGRKNRFLSAIGVHMEYF